MFFRSTCSAAGLLTPPLPLQPRREMGLKMAFFDLPNGGMIEVVAPTGPDSVLRPALDKSGPGMNLMACDSLS